MYIYLQVHISNCILFHRDFVPSRDEIIACLVSMLHRPTKRGKGGVFPWGPDLLTVQVLQVL